MKNIEFTNHIKNEFINIRNSVNGNNEIEISGEIGQSWFNDGYTFDKFKNDLNGMDGKIVINIKSMGGNLFEALAIYDHIRSLKNKVVTKIVGSSASAATIISLAGDKRYISENSRYLIHKPMITSMGNSDDFEKVLSTLKDLDKQVVDLYVKRTKLSAEQVIELMREEKFISSAEAIEKGFVDDYVRDKDYVQNKENNIKNIKSEDMNKEILDMLQVTNDAEAYEKIKSMLATEVVNKFYIDETQEATNEETNTEIQATEASASEDVIVNEVNNGDEVINETKEDEVKDSTNKTEKEVEEKEETETENKEDEETVEDLKAKIKALEKSLKEKEDKEAEDKLQNFMNFLQEATNAGKITNKSHNDWVNIYNDKGEDFAMELLNNIPERKITNTVDKVLEDIAPNMKNKSKDEIMNDWKAGKITGEVAAMLLK